MANPPTLTPAKLPAIQYCIVHMYEGVHDYFWSWSWSCIRNILSNSQLDAAKEETDIEDILEKPENMAIINASNWSPTCPI